MLGLYNGKGAWVVSSATTTGVPFLALLSDGADERRKRSAGANVSHAHQHRRFTVIAAAHRFKVVKFENTAVTFENTSPPSAVLTGRLSSALGFIKLSARGHWFPPARRV